MSQKILLKKYIKGKSLCGRVITEIKKIAGAWSDYHVGTFGASVAYYTIFSIAPVLVIAISIAGIFLNKSSVQAGILAQFKETFGQNSSDFIQSLIQANTSDSTNIIVSIAGFILLLIGAAGIFSQLQTALDTIFDSFPAKKLPKGFWFSMRQKVLSFGMVLAIGFLLLISLVLSALVVVFGRTLAHYVPMGEIIGYLIEFIVSFALISAFLTLTYKILPSKRLALKPAIVGGLVTGILFTISKFLLGVYLGSSQLITTYGAASTLVLFVLWAYYISQVFFFGAIILKLYVVPKTT